MNKDIFWDLIEKSKQNSEDLFEMAEILSKELIKYSEIEILHFEHIFRIYDEVATASKLMALSSLLVGGLSEETFEYFKGWLIGMGKEIYLGTLKNLDSICEMGIDFEELSCDFEEIIYLGEQTYYEKLGINDGEIENYYKYKEAMEKNILDEKLVDEIFKEIDAEKDLYNPIYEEKHEKSYEKLKETFPKTYKIIRGD